MSLFIRHDCARTYQFSKTYKRVVRQTAAREASKIYGRAGWPVTPWTIRKWAYQRMLELLLMKGA